MAEEVRLEVATPAHAAQLAPLMRQADADEALAAGGYTPMAALLASLEASEVAYAAFAGGELLGLCGVAPLEGYEDAPRAVVWALTSTAVERHRRAFWRLSRLLVAVFRDVYHGGLTAYVDARHTAALRWLRRLGFTVNPAAPFGPEGLPFHAATLAAPRHD